MFYVMLLNEIYKTCNIFILNDNNDVSVKYYLVNGKLVLHFIQATIFKISR